MRFHHLHCENKKVKVKVKVKEEVKPSNQCIITQ